MSLSNWKGSSGWLSMEDPTGVLNGICLQASSGIGQLCEDYITQEIGTSNDFNKVHYTAQCDLAYRSGADFNVSIAMVARASDYTTSVKKPYIPQKGYIGIVDFNRRKVEILRRIGALDYLLVSSDLNYSILPNTKNTFSLTCYGNSESGGTTLALKVNGIVLGTYTDFSGNQILSGEAGFQVQNGTVYINNFSIMELDSSGNAV